MKNFTIPIFLFFVTFSAPLLAQTSWTGTQNNNWNVPHNWTNGVPDATTGAVVGDENFTGNHHPVIRQNASFRSLTLGAGASHVTLSVRGNITISEDITIEENGSLQQQSNSQITLEGNWENRGNYSGQSSNSWVIFSGISQTISGTTTFSSLTINSGSTVQLLDDTSVEHQIIINGTFNPGYNHQLMCSGTLDVSPGGEILVKAAEFGDNYLLTGTVNLDGRSTVHYASATQNQAISGAFNYGYLKISGGTTKWLSENLPALQSSLGSYGRIIVEEGTLDLREFIANRGNTSAGGAFILATDAVLKIGGNGSFPANFHEVSLAPNSLVHYNGDEQTISGRAYGNLHLSSKEGEAEKTMQISPLTVAGDLTIFSGEGTSVVFSSADNITVNRNFYLGANCIFQANTHYHTFRGNWENHGEFLGNTSTVVFNGAGAELLGYGSQNFHHLTFEATGISAESSVNITVSGDISTSGQGSFTHKTGGNLTLSGETPTISGNAFSLYNLNIGSATKSTASILLAGNLTAEENFEASEGSVTLTGHQKHIGGSGDITFFELHITGSITTDKDIGLVSNFSVLQNAQFEATAGTVYFMGTTSLSGKAMLYHAQINEDKILILDAQSTLGIAGNFTPLGTLDVTTTTPNTVVYNSLLPQNVAATTYHNLVLRNAGAKTALGNIQINRDFTIEEEAAFYASAHILTLHRHFNNQGNFWAETSVVEMTGSASAHIAGESEFNVLQINKSNPSVNISLLGNTSAATLHMISGNMHTGKHAVTITQERTGNGIILGTIIRTHSFTHGETYHFESPQNFILFSSPSAGVDSVIVKVALRQILDFIPGKEAVMREYEISIPNGSYTDATLRLHYENNELNAFMEQHLALYRHVEENVWDSVGVSSRNSELNFVEKTNIESGIEGRWAMSGLRNIVQWNGMISHQWEDPQNWTTLSGEDMSDRVPASGDAVYIGHQEYNYHPVINSNQEITAIQFGGAQACTLTINDNFTLTILGSAGGYYPDNQIHTLDVGSGALDIGTNLVLSDGSPDNGIILSIAGGHVTVNDNLIHDTGGEILFYNGGSLTLNGNYQYLQGNFTPGNGTVTYAGAGQQQVAPINYFHLQFSNPAGHATLGSYAFVSGNLSLLGGSSFEINDSLKVEGNVLVDENSTLHQNTSHPLHIRGNWHNEGLFEMEGGSVVFCGTSAQEISSGRFNSLVIDKESGTTTLTGNITLNNNLTIERGTFDLSQWSVARTNPGGILTLGPLAKLVIQGSDNFPENFSSQQFEPNSTVEYAGEAQQYIRNHTYGNLVLKNGNEENPKVLLRDIEVSGNLEIKSNAALHAGANTINLYGNLSNEGQMLPSSGTLVLWGEDATLHGNLTLYNLTVLGSYLTYGESIHVEGDMLVGAEGSFNLQNTDISLCGDLTNRGILQSDAIATFTGIRLQTIQLENSVNSSSTGQIVFDGTIAPVLNSNTNPQFATVHIKNTGGIKASVPWNVAVAMVVHPDASFDGGALTHTFNGHFYNYGSIRSTGTLVFAPLYFPADVMLDNGTEYSVEGNTIICGTQPAQMSGTTNSFTNLTIRSVYPGGFTPHTSLTIHESLYIEPGSVFNAGDEHTHTLLGRFTNNGTFNGQSSHMVFAGQPTSMEGAGDTHFYNLIIDEEADFFLRKTINIEKDFMLSTTDFNTLGNGIVFTGTASSSINSSVGPVTFDYLEQYKDNNSATELMVPVYVANDLVLTRGLITSSEDNLLTLVHEAWASPGNATSYVDGPLSKKGNKPFVFPLGNDGVFARIGISAPLSEEAEFRARYYANPFHDTLNVEYPLHIISHREHWILDRINGEDNVNVTLYWENSNYSGVRNLDDIVVARYDGEKWVDHTNLGGVSETLHKGYVTSEAITDFSPFTLGSTSDANPLPVEFLHFSAAYNAPVAELNWSTASEINNDFFTVERSRNGVEFEAIEKLPGAGTSSSLIHYHTVDPKPLEGISFYRIKQTDFDGTFKYSHIVALSTHTTQSERLVQIFPNPARAGNLNIHISNMPGQHVTIEVLNLRGLQVFSQRIATHGSKFVALKPNLPASLSPGQYLVRITAEDFTLVESILIQ